MESMMHSGLDGDVSVLFDRVTPAAERVLSCEASSAEELAAAVPSWRLEFLQLERGEFQGSAICLTFDHVLICRGSMNRSLLQRYTTPPQCVTIARPGRNSSPMLFRGRPINEGECLIGGPAEDGEAVSLNAHSSLAVSVRLEVWQSESHWLTPSPLSSIMGVELLAPGSKWIALFIDTLDRLTSAVLQSPDVMQRAGPRRGLEEWLLARICACRPADIAPSCSRSARTRRRVAVERARTYIHENLTETITLSDLCRHAHVQSRSLEYGFRQVLGLTPMAYVKVLRLHRARGLLRSAPPHARQVSEIALDCGFWHLSQFAADYKKYFGESPSSTGRRTLAATGWREAAPSCHGAGLVLSA